MKIQQIIYNMRQQPVISVVSIIGTALAIFMIMIVMLMQQVNVMDTKPEVNRSRTLYAPYICFERQEEGGNATWSGSMSQQTIAELYGDIENVEKVGVYTTWNDDVELTAPGAAPLMAASKGVNSDFFGIIEYEFIDGRPFAEDQTMLKQAVIAESVARRLYGTAQAAGRRLLINRTPYTVAGVVKDVNPITPMAYAEVLTQIPPMDQDAQPDDSEAIRQYFGEYGVLLLTEGAAVFPAIKRTVANRFAALNDKVKADGWGVKYFDSPYTIAESIEVVSSNNAPDFEGARRMRLATFAILLLVPAINLSSLTQTRMRQQMADIGLKRAFGCTRARIMGEIFVENFAYTIAGAVIGLVASIVAAWLFGSLVFDPEGWNQKIAFNPLEMLSWATFGWAILFCLLLNLLSSSVPTFIAARVNPAEALSGHAK